MAKTYYTYRIRVANRDRVQVEKWDTQHQDKGQPSGAFRHQEKQAEITPLLQIVRNNELNDSTSARSLGEALFDVLFDDLLRQDFVNFYYQVVQQEKQLLRVELDIDEQGMPEIAALPWEFMCVPARANLGTIWMGTVPDLVFSRRRSQWIAAQPIQLESDEKLRIALIISAPPNLPPVAYEPVQAALEKLAVEQANRVELLPFVSSANPEAIDTILSKDPHIFHFIGHGRMQNEGKQEIGEMALVDPDFDEAMWVDADYFSELFNQHRPGVVMLQACEGGMLSSSQAFVGVASKVVQQNVPVVVAMQYEVTNSTASRFALRFYQQLVAEDPVDIAAQYGRRAIALGATQYRKRDFATPVIFMRVRDGYLFKHRQIEGEPRQRQKDALRQYRAEIEAIIYKDYGDNSRQIHPISRKALNEWQKKLEISPEEADTVEAEVLNTCLNYEEKVKEYKQVLADKMQEEDTLDEKTRNRFKIFQKALGLEDETVALAFTSLGNKLHKQGELQKAVSLFKEAISISTNIPGAYIGLGVIFYNQGERKEGLKKLAIAKSLFEKQGMRKEAKQIEQFYLRK